MSGNQTRIKLTAYHEAGHAMAALREGIQVNRVVAYRGIPGKGVCTFNIRQKNPYDVESSPGSAIASWAYTLETTRSDIRIFLAGPLAHAKILGKPLRSLGAKSDLTKCLNLASRLTHLHSYVSQFAEIAPIDTENILNTERLRVRRWLAQPKVWNAVELIAGKLSLTGQMGNLYLDELIGISNTPEMQGVLNFWGRLLQIRRTKNGTIDSRYSQQATWAF